MGEEKRVLLDAGLFIGALLKGDIRHQEARTIVDTARRVHDARHAATALVNSVTSVYTYDSDDWLVFKPQGLTITGPPSVLTQINRKTKKNRA